MCGLFGFVALGREALGEEEVERGRRALATLSHRGPDQWGEWIGGNVYVGHRRLSILDLSEQGRQPMVSDDGTVVLAVNGEIYNYQDIKRELHGCVFRSRSDSEVMLHGYRAWDMERLLDRMDGMYAAVLFDRDKRRLFLVRDRAGIKPLFYAQIGGYFVWASELKAIRDFVGPAALTDDRTALYDFLTYRYVPAPKTAFRDVYKLEPAHCLDLGTSDGGLKLRRYWLLDPEPAPPDRADNADRLRALIGDSVREQLMSDVPVGFFLSGGIDSSIVVAEAARHHAAPVAFSIGFDDKAHDETAYAKVVADRFGAEHKVRTLAIGDAGDLFDRMLNWYDEPFADSSALPSYHVAQLAREHSVVALTGDGGDELFGGYRWYAAFDQLRSRQSPLSALRHLAPAPRYRRNSPRIVDRIRNRLHMLTRFDPLELYAMLLGGMAAEEKAPFRELWGIAPDYDDFWRFREYYRPELGRRRSLQLLDFHTYLPDDILTKVDRVSMAVSLEARVPFLSRSVIEFAFGLPESFLYRGDVLKGGLKLAYRDILPAEILDRGKKGFSIPMHVWRKTLMGRSETLQEAMIRSYAGLSDKTLSVAA